MSFWQIFMAVVVALAAYDIVRPIVEGIMGTVL